MNALIQRARVAGEQLAAAMTEFNAALLAFQEELVALNLGVTAHVELPPTDGDGAIRLLAFDRIAGKWCIGVLVRGDMKPLLNASRATRIAAAPLMTALLSVMVAEAEKISADTLNAKASIDEALEHIRALKEER